MCTLKPPFKANDMNGLYKKVLKGHFEPIKKVYSPALQQIIADLLNV